MSSIISDMGISVGTLALTSILKAALTAIVCIVAIKLIMKMLDRVLGKSKLNEQVCGYAKRAIKAALYIIGVIIVCNDLGINMTSLTALLSVLTLGITLAAEDILGNVAGGMVILSTHPFKIGDFIEAGGISGNVLEIGLNHTKLQTADGQIIMQPNRELAGSKIVNYTTLGRRRIVIKVTASYDAPTEDVKAACREAIMGTPNVLTDPAPEVYLTNYGESSIEYMVRCWTAVDDYWPAYFTLNETIRETFAKHHVEMTYDHLNVHIVEK